MEKAGEIKLEFDWSVFCWVPVPTRRKDATHFGAFCENTLEDYWQIPPDITNAWFIITPEAQEGSWRYVLDPVNSCVSLYKPTGKRARHGAKWLSPTFFNYVFKRFGSEGYVSLEYEEDVVE